MIEGEHILHIIPLGIRLESRVSSKVAWYIRSSLGSLRVLQDSAVVGLIRNPLC